MTDRQTKIYSVADGTARSGTTKHTTTKHGWSADRLRYAMQNTDNALSTGDNAHQNLIINRSLQPTLHHQIPQEKLPRTPRDQIHHPENQESCWFGTLTDSSCTRTACVLGVFGHHTTRRHTFNFFFSIRWCVWSISTSRPFAAAAP